MACATHASHGWCGALGVYQSGARAGSPPWGLVGVQTRHRVQRAGGTYKTPVTTTLSRSLLSLLLFCASLSARSWSSYSLHIPPAPSHRRTFTGPLREDKATFCTRCCGTVSSAEEEEEEQSPPKANSTHHRNEARSYSSGSTHPGPLPCGLGRLRQRYDPLTPPSPFLSLAFCGWLTDSCCCCCCCCRPKQV